LELEESTEVAPAGALPTMSEPSVLLSELMQSILYASLPVLAQGRNWILLYRFPHVFYSDMFGLLTMCAYCHLMFMFIIVQHMEAWDIVIYFI
jgi:hypothetical protein